jgi:predicted secreted protein
MQHFIIKPLNEMKNSEDPEVGEGVGTAADLGMHHGKLICDLQTTWLSMILESLSLILH